MVKNRRGFTVVETVIAMLLLTGGLLGVASATAGMSRMLSRAKGSTAVAAYGQEVLERLRAGGCAALADSSTSFDSRYLFTWTVTTPSGTKTKRIRLVATYPGAGSTRVDTLETSIPCG